ncbi:MAG: M56 family metallopeptidase [Dehalococcoidia bacterium]|nr:M56 family metallopeptidase [Dehalococcoidia bacterium]
MQRILSSLTGLVLLMGVTLAASAATLHAVGTHTVGRDHWLGSAEVVSSIAFGGLATLGLLGLMPMGGFLLGAWRLVRARRLVKELVRGATPSHVGGREVWRLSYPGMACFAAGNIRPRIFVSGSTLGLEAELREAALLHEEAHLKQRAPLRRALLSLFATTWWFLPGARQAAENESLRLEVEADDDALRRGAGRRSLFDAIVQAATVTTPSGVGLANVAVGPRLERLAGGSMESTEGAGLWTAVVLAFAAISPAIAHFGVLLGLACF